MPSFIIKPHYFAQHILGSTIVAICKFAQGVPNKYQLLTV